MILENLKTAGVQQAHKEDRITFTRPDAVAGRPHLRRRPLSGGRASRSAPPSSSAPSSAPSPGPDLVAAAREAGDAGFDVLIACAFNYDAHASEFSKLGRIPVLKARMNADLHMARRPEEHRQGQPVRGLRRAGHRDPARRTTAQIRVKVNGVDVFNPRPARSRSDGADGIACWFIDTDYNEESFFVRHAYFLGPNDPYKALKTTLKAEIDEDGWATLNSDISRPFAKPTAAASP